MLLIVIDLIALVVWSYLVVNGLHTFGGAKVCVCPKPEIQGNHCSVTGNWSLETRLRSPQSLLCLSVHPPCSKMLRRTLVLSSKIPKIDATKAAAAAAGGEPGVDVSMMPWKNFFTNHLKKQLGDEKFQKVSYSIYHIKTCGA